MTIPSEFWRTTGKLRFEAVLKRYDEQQLSAKMAVEYLAELFPQSDHLTARQQTVVDNAYALIHDLSDGLYVAEGEFEALLSQR